MTIPSVESFVLFGGNYDAYSIIMELLKFLLFYLSGILAGTAGGAGGALFIPVLLVLFDFYVFAIPLSRAAVLGAACAFAIQNLSNRKPPKGCVSLIAYDVAVMMEPMTLLGTSIGVRLNKMCPQWMIVGTLIMVLSTSAASTWRKANKKYEEENKLFQSEALSAKSSPRAAAAIPLAAVGSTSGEAQPSGQGQGQGQGQADMEAGGVAQSGDDEQPLLGTSNAPIDPRQQHLLMPMSAARCFGSIFVCWITVLAVNFALIDLGARTVSGVVCGTAEFWAVFCSAIPVIVAVTYWNALHLNKMEVLREKDSVQVAADSVRWNVRNLAVYSAACLMAGAVGALAGVGGSTIKGPLLLQFGLDPLVAQATAQLMLLTTVSSTMIQYWYLQMLPTGYAVVFFLLGFASGYSGQALMDWIVARYRRTSMVVYALAGYILIAVLSMTAIGINQIIKDYHNQYTDRFWFRSMCAPVCRHGVCH
eukprot:TRINITY_DN3058_c0_g2_i1.p1 TRINITY_DN3058_c0_g2~~TRINITY_DN3058_c0_g2_i1.p1  ORF type:complete len:508 (+),score=167.93 TRINITY_DN3058_c0_g2_i1:96-1526(+)